MLKKYCFLRHKLGGSVTRRRRVIGGHFRQNSSFLTQEFITLTAFKTHLNVFIVKIIH